MSKIKLFCFPYAGGSAAVYSRWQSYFKQPYGIEIVPVELTGRGKRILEPLYRDLPHAVDDLYNLIRDDIRDGPYAFFGHSLGSLLIYELAQKIRRMEVAQPLHLFFSGRGAPNIEYTPMNYHLMSDQEFKEEVIRLGGTPQEFFDHPELTEIFLPFLKNDFRLAETDTSKRKLDPFNCNISMFTGKEDYRVCQAQVDAWAAHTTANCAVHYMDGGHFFLHHKIPEIAELIIKALRRQVQPNVGFY
ncbi:thioesterase II family protein [Chitinophaga sp.]|uniref:thioesterase II family protein n=1 Tax=Chitinophaga sp. TaxID=1869181 RepID=UPI002F92FDAA